MMDITPLGTTELNTTEPRQPSDHRAERAKLERAGSLHWFHWFIVLLSFGLTFFAWSHSKNQLADKIAAQFEKESNQAVELIRERLAKYEDALWGGVAYMDASEEEVTFNQWLLYAQSLRLEKKYPGINGIGVIHHVHRDEHEDYLANRHKLRPQYKVHPEHERPVLMPISYIVPVAENAAAVGLDMAHESNRYTAAIKARDQGKAQITGPIALVQDEGSTPGFLFYAPFYRDGDSATPEARRDNFQGMVYAPFVMHKLMAGTLGREKRHIAMRFSDGDTVLFDEHTTSDTNYDPSPLLEKQVQVPVYGRTWHIDIKSDASFRAMAASSEPATILIGGITVDVLLIGLFIMMTRTSKRTLGFADAMTRGLEERNDEYQHLNVKLADINHELEQFVYTVSHDLKSPIVSQMGLIDCIREDLEAEDYGMVQQSMDRMLSATQRMERSINDLLNLCRIGRIDHFPVTVDMNSTVKSVLLTLEKPLRETQTTVRIEGNLGTVVAAQDQMIEVFENLIGNALKYGLSEGPNEIVVGAEDHAQATRYFVRDKGQGIDPKFHQKIFGLFQRLDSDKTKGTGVGLAIVARILHLHHGKAWVESEPGQGATFWVEFPKAATLINGKPKVKQAA